MAQEQDQSEPPPVPYTRFKQSREALRQAKEQMSRLEQELAKFKEAAKSAPKGDTDGWLDAVFGASDKDDVPTAKEGKGQQALPAGDPIIEQIKAEYAERQLDATLKAYSHIPEEVMLPALASGLDPETIAESYEVLRKTILKGQPQAAPTAGQGKSPPPRPAGTPSLAAAPQQKKPTLPDNQYERVEFIARLMEQAG